MDAKRAWWRAPIEDVRNLSHTARKCKYNDHAKLTSWKQELEQSISIVQQELTNFKSRQYRKRLTFAASASLLMQTRMLDEVVLLAFAPRL